MTRGELAAFHAGVRLAADHAPAAAEAIERSPGFREARQGFATAALRALAEAEADLMLSEHSGLANSSNPAAGCS